VVFLLLIRHPRDKFRFALIIAYSRDIPLFGRLGQIRDRGIPVSYKVKDLSKNEATFAPGLGKSGKKI
jgi:hypothetical protein